MVKKVSYENPLIPHARMRALYRGLVEMRVLGERLPLAERIPRGLEACWVGTAIDLKDGDLTSDRAGAAWPSFVRGIVARGGTGVVRKNELQLMLEQPKPVFAGNATERLLCATGAAMALKAAGARGAALAYLRTGELSAEGWARLLRVASVGDLPLIVVAAGVAEPMSLPRSIAKGPMIPVDAADVVAIYRVAQESLLRARAEGGIVVIECVKTRPDPIAVMARQLVAKGIATEAWLASVETGVRRGLARL